MDPERDIEHELAQLRAQLEAQDAELRELRPLKFDPVTGLRVRRIFERDCAEVVGTDGTTEASLVTVDLDYLTLWNDRYGHTTGDAVLRALTTTLQAHSPEAYARWYRVGGDEIAGLLPINEPAIEQMLRQAQSDCELMRIKNDQPLPPSFVFGHCSVAEMEEAQCQLMAECPELAELSSRDFVTLRKLLLIQIADGRTYTSKMYRRLLLLTQILERDGAMRFDELARWLLKGAGEITRDTVFALADTLDMDERIEQVESVLERIFAAEMKTLQHQLQSSPGVCKPEVVRRRIVLEHSRALPVNSVPRLF